MKNEDKTTKELRERLAEIKARKEQLERELLGLERAKNKENN